MNFQRPVNATSPFTGRSGLSSNEEAPGEEKIFDGVQQFRLELGQARSEIDALTKELKTAEARLNQTQTQHQRELQQKNKEIQDLEKDLIDAANMLYKSEQRRKALERQGNPSTNSVIIMTPSQTRAAAESKISTRRSSSVVCISPRHQGLRCANPMLYSPRVIGSPIILQSPLRPQGFCQCDPSQPVRTVVSPVLPAGSIHTSTTLSYDQTDTSERLLGTPAGSTAQNLNSRFTEETKDSQAKPASASQTAADKQSDASAHNRPSASSGQATPYRNAPVSTNPAAKESSSHSDMTAKSSRSSAKSTSSHTVTGATTAPRQEFRFGPPPAKAEEKSAQPNLGGTVDVPIPNSSAPLFPAAPKTASSTGFNFGASSAFSFGSKPIPAAAPFGFGVSGAPAIVAPGSAAPSFATDGNSMQTTTGPTVGFGAPSSFGSAAAAPAFGFGSAAPTFGSASDGKSMQTTTGLTFGFGAPSFGSAAAAPAFGFGSAAPTFGSTSGPGF